MAPKLLTCSKVFANATAASETFNPDHPKAKCMLSAQISRRA
jgi:hypothetical protein